MARPLYRSRQVLHALRPRILEEEIEYARMVLSDAEAELFFAMERRDQRHALQVVSRVRLETNDADVLVAALLHDCGKGDVPVWLRVVKVVSPRLLRRLSAPAGPGWRGAAHRLYAHVEIGASLVAEAGSSTTVVRLIAGQPEPHEAWKALLLAKADDAS